MAIELTLWHAMSGAFGDRDFFKNYIDALAARFNRSQSEYAITPIYKGPYPEAERASLEAYRAGNPPHIFQSWEVGAATILAAACTLRPDEVMQEAGDPWDPAVYLPSVLNYYADASGEMTCFPFNISTPILYYNKDAFARAGLDPRRAPETWPEVVEAAAALKASGVRHGYATTRHRWVHLDNFSAWHDVELATKSNGLDGAGARLCLNSPLHVRHIQNLADQYKPGLFTYFGPALEAEPAFWSGACAMITTASAPYAGIVKRARFEVGVGPLPYYADVAGAPQNTLPAGSALWVMRGKSKEEYAGVARFIAYASRPEVQADRHRQIGYHPVSTGAYGLTADPSTEVALRGLTPQATRRSRGVRLRGFERIDAILSEELSRVWSGREGAQAALDRAAARGNQVLEELERAT